MSMRMGMSLWVKKEGGVILDESEGGKRMRIDE